MRFVQPPPSAFAIDSPLFVGAIIALTFVLAIVLIMYFFPSLAQSQALSRRSSTRQRNHSVTRPNTKPVAVSAAQSATPSGRLSPFAPSDVSDFTRLTALPPTRVTSAPQPRQSAPNPRLGIDATRQMKAVQHNTYQRTPLLNREEARLLPVLERIVLSFRQGHRVMAQVSLGEVIKPTHGSDPDAHAAINSKRLDFGIFDATGLLVCAVEYQGTGHFQGNAAQRDAVKREALHKAGVPMLEIRPDFAPETIACDLWPILRPATPRQ